MKALYDFLLYIPFITVGVGILLVFYKFFPLKKKNSKKFSSLKFLLFITSPVIGTTLFVYRIGWETLYVYFFFCILGAFFEWCTGFLYHKLMGEKLWAYERSSIGGYTSFYAIPLWGFLGVLFWLAARVFV